MCPGILEKALWVLEDVDLGLRDGMSRQANTYRGNNNDQPRVTIRFYCVNEHRSTSSRRVQSFNSSPNDPSLSPSQYAIRLPLLTTTSWSKLVTVPSYFEVDQHVPLMPDSFLRVEKSLGSTRSTAMSWPDGKASSPLSLDRRDSLHCAFLTLVAQTTRNRRRPGSRFGRASNSPSLPALIGRSNHSPLQARICPRHCLRHSGDHEVRCPCRDVDSLAT